MIGLRTRSRSRDSDVETVGGSRGGDCHFDRAAPGGLVLRPLPCDRWQRMLSALNRLRLIPLSQVALDMVCWRS